MHSILTSNVKNGTNSTMKQNIKKKKKSKATDHWIQSSIITNFHLSSSIPWLGSPSPNTKEKTYQKTKNPYLYLETKRVRGDDMLFHLHHTPIQWSSSCHHQLVAFASYNNMDPSTFHGIKRNYVSKHFSQKEMSCFLFA